MTHTHHTAPTRFVEVDGVRFAYRRFGAADGIPLVFLQHFTGTMDSWDPAVVDGFAAEREVILFDNTGVSRSSGVAPSSISTMADAAAAFIAAQDLRRVDLLGFSLGGFVAQVLAARYPELVRRVILAGTGPEGGAGIAALAQVVAEGSKASPNEPRLYLFFDQTASSQRAARDFINRQSKRVVDRDPIIDEQTFNAQLEAIVQWGASSDPESEVRLQDVTQPVLIVNGKSDVMVPTENSFQLFRRLKDARLILYPDSGHGALFQFAGAFVDEGLRFLKEDTLQPARQHLKATSLNTSMATQLQ